MAATILIYLLQLVLSIWWVVFMHELSHAMMVWKAGGKVTSFVVFPHVKDDRLLLGHVAFDGGVPIENSRYVPYIYFAPVATSAFAFVVLLVANICFWKYDILLILMLLHLEDLVKWFVDYTFQREGTDGQLYRKYKEEIG
jgi:hypothetical protein